MDKMTNEERREAGRSHYEYFRELLAQDGDKATATLHADHMRSLIVFASLDER